MKYRLGLIAIFCSSIVAKSQQQKIAKDTTPIKTVYLADVTIVGRNSKSDIQQMPEIVGTSIYAGKKNSLIILDNVQGNVVNNTMRQVLAKVPGIQIWESDPSGAQIGIAARGLSPNRSWEFNVRQNGYDIAADPFGYPEAYYNPQLQGVQRIEIIRGQGSLQYGPQFGGMVNYILKNGSEIHKKIEFETIQTFGSNGLFNSFNALGGKTSKTNYYTFFDHRNGNGWRDNSQFEANNGFATFTYHFTKKLQLTTELTVSTLRSQQAGGLTDVQLQQNAKQSYRNRNWFDIKWTIPALLLDYQINEKAKWTTKLFATIGDRKSVGFIAPITTLDTINRTTLQYNNRTLNADAYRNYGIESRILSDYKIGNKTHTISAGLRFYTGTTHREANGKGTTGSNYTMERIGQHPLDIQFQSNNAAVFVENVFRLNKKLIFIPGIRYEWLEGSANGRTSISPTGVPNTIQDVTKARSLALLGVGTEYHISKQTEFYASYAEAYRPIQFANLQAAPTTDVIDPNLSDAMGYNIDLGYRGKIKNFMQFDISSFYMLYGNRVGTITPTGTTTRLITNVGSSVSKGIEAFLEVNILKAIHPNKNANLLVFCTYSYNDAKYNSNHKDVDTKGKKVENAPAHIVRTGVTMSVKSILFTTQFSHVSKTFSDANNTLLPTVNGQVGLIPSYSVVDLTANFKFKKQYNLKCGVNNLFDNTYFTRRSGGYPGPGILPADGRTFFVSIGAKM